MGTRPGTRHLGKLAGRIVAKKVATKMPGNVAANMVENIPEKMRNNGIIASASKQFQRGNVIVIQVNIEGVDARKLVETKVGKERAEKIDGWLSLLPARIRGELQYFMLQ